MALYICSCHSLTLKTYITYYVILPNDYTADPNTQSLDDYYGGKQKSYRTLYLLHGGSADASTWLRFSNIEQYADDLGVAVVMPTAGNYYYTDMAHGDKWFTFVAEEIPRMARSAFPLSAKKEDNYVGGLSMGGYGALKLALTYPDRYSGCISLSGVVDIMDLLRCGLWDYMLPLDDIFGSDRERTAGGPNDIFALTEKLCRTSAAFPKLYLAVGSEDYFSASNKKYSAFLAERGVAHEFVCEAGGHDFKFWDSHLAQGMKKIIR